MKVLIVEDETAAAENLAEMLYEIDPGIQVLGNTESVQQTVRWLQGNERPDLIFMDIHLSDGSSFAIFQQMEVEIPIIFTTAYDPLSPVLPCFRTQSTGAGYGLPDGAGSARSLSYLVRSYLFTTPMQVDT